jgi:hypothetical protein
MAMTASQRRILAKTENEIRGTDPRLASILGAFSRLNRDEQMPQTEQLSARRRLFLRLLPRKLAAPSTKLSMVTPAACVRMTVHHLRALEFPADLPAGPPRWVRP